MFTFIYIYPGYCNNVDFIDLDMSKQLIHIVDDDPEIQRTISRLLKSVGMTTRCYNSGEQFLKDYDYSSGCILLDVRLRGMSGPSLHYKINEAKY